MANIIISRASGELKNVFGEIAAPIAAFIEQRDQAYQTESIANKIFTKVTSTHPVEAYASMTGGDEWLPVGEGEPAPTNGFKEGFTQIIENVTWKSSFAITQEAIEDDQIGAIKDTAAKRAQTYELTRERFFARLLAEAIKGNTSFTIGGKTFSTKGADGVCVFAKNHPYAAATGTQSNVFSNAFTASNLSKVMTAMQDFRGDKKEILSLNPDTIIIPNIASLKEEVFGVLGATHDPTTAAGNKAWYLTGNLNIIVWPYLNEFITADSAPWILLDSKYNELYKTAINQERVPLEWRSTYDESKCINLWTGRARFTGGFVDWRGIAVGGVTGGTTIS